MMLSLKNFLFTSLTLCILFTSTTYNVVNGASLNDKNGLDLQNGNSQTPGRLKKDADPEPNSHSQSNSVSDSENVLDLNPDYFLHRLVEKYRSPGSDQISLSVADLDNLIHSLKNVHLKSSDPESESESAEEESHYSKSKKKREITSGSAVDYKTSQDEDSKCTKDDWAFDQDCVEERCLSGDDLYELYHISSGDDVNASNLRQMSPAILYEVQKEGCRNNTVPRKTHRQKRQPTTAEVWGYSFLCVTLINLCALCGLFFLPLMNKAFYKKLLMFMAALAVGTLCGSAILVLIPESYGLTEEEDLFLDVYLWKATTVIGGIYLFFLVERLLKNFMEWRHSLDEIEYDEPCMMTYCEHQQEDTSHLQNLPISSVKTRAITRKDSMNMSFKVPSGVHSSSSSAKLVANSSMTSKDSTSCLEDELANGDKGCINPAYEEYVTPPPQILSPSPPAAVTNGKPLPEKKEQVVKKEKGFQEKVKNGLMAEKASTAGTSQSGEKEGIRSVAWMVIVGDGLHNFIDGLSIGAAFADSLLAGISVSVAVICEELPHELGDFAILLNSGMSMKQAVGYNFLSACMCYLGLVVGIVVGEQTSGSQWIFALAGGMFLYISLVDLLPEVNHAGEEEVKETGHTIRVFLLQNAGMLLGYGIILFLAFFTEHIDFENV